jgi:acetoin utilization protein AcuC
VLTISVHQNPATLFPFTGLPAETGGPGAEGSAVNVALPARSSDAAWLRAFHAVVPPLLRRFPAADPGQPARRDTHRRDPLAHCQSVRPRLLGP